MDLRCVSIWATLFLPNSTCSVCRNINLVGRIYCRVSQPRSLYTSPYLLRLWWVAPAQPNTTTRGFFSGPPSWSGGWARNFLSSASTLVMSPKVPMTLWFSGGSRFCTVFRHRFANAPTFSCLNTKQLIIVTEHAVRKALCLQLSQLPMCDGILKDLTFDAKIIFQIEIWESTFTFIFY